MTEPTASPVAEYWEKNAVSWERGAYRGSPHAEGQARFLDRLSTMFRGDYVERRMNAAAGFLAPHVGGLTVLDVGCASGRFAVRLLEGGAARVSGVDVCDSAIEMADRLRPPAYTDALEFRRADVTQPDVQLPPVDVVSALGVIEYFDEDLLAIFLGNLKTRYIFFDFPRLDRHKALAVAWPLRRVYLRLRRCPGVYFHAFDAFHDIAARAGFGDVRLVRCSGYDFVTNLPGQAHDDRR